MDIDGFRALLDAHGGDPARWPAAARDDALVLLAAEPRARAVLDDARRLDALIRAAAPELRGTGTGTGRDTAFLNRLKAIPAERPQIVVIDGGRGTIAAATAQPATTAQPGVQPGPLPGAKPRHQPKPRRQPGAVSDRTSSTPGRSPAFAARLGGAVAAAALLMGMLIGGNGWMTGAALALDTSNDIDIAAVLYAEQGTLEEPQ